MTLRLSAILLLLGAAPASAAPRIVSAAGNWAVLREGRTCEATSAGLLAATKERQQARASVAFDAPEGRRNGEFAVRLSRAARPGGSVILHIGEAGFLLVGQGEWAWSRGPAQEAAIIAALRGGGGLRVEARSAGGGRFVDRFDSNGAATAIDGAAACSATLDNR